MGRCRRRSSRRDVPGGPKVSGANANLGLQAAGALYAFVGLLCQFMSKSPSSIAEVRWRTRVYV